MTVPIIFTSTTDHSFTLLLQVHDMALRSIQEARNSRTQTHTNHGLSLQNDEGGIVILKLFTCENTDCFIIISC